MLQPRGQRRPWQYVGAYAGNRMSPPEKRLSPNIPPSPSPSPPPSPSSPSSANNNNNNNNHHYHYQHDGMLTGSPQSNMIPGAPHHNQRMQLSPVVPLPLSQMDGQGEAREGRVRQPNRHFANDQAQQPNIRNFARVRTAAARARNASLRIARDNNINLTPPENLGK